MEKKKKKNQKKNLNEKDTGESCTASKLTPSISSNFIFFSPSSGEIVAGEGCSLIFLDVVTLRLGIEVEQSWTLRNDKQFGSTLTDRVTRRDEQRTGKDLLHERTNICFLRESD